MATVPQRAREFGATGVGFGVLGNSIARSGPSRIQTRLSYLPSRVSVSYGIGRRVRT